MPRPDPVPTQLDRDLADLRLLEIARCYREVLDEAARKGSSMLEVLATLIGMEQTVRQQRALERRLRHARLPKQKTLTGYDCWLGEASRPVSPAFKTVHETRRLTRLLCLLPLFMRTHQQGFLLADLVDERHRDSDDAATRSSTHCCSSGPRPCGAVRSKRLPVGTIVGSRHIVPVVVSASLPGQD